MGLVHRVRTATVVRTEVVIMPQLDPAHRLRRCALLWLVCALFALCVQIGWSPRACAATIHIPADHPTIQAALAAAMPADEILVGPGIYFENIIITKAITLRAPDGAGSTTIASAGAGLPVVRILTPAPPEPGAPAVVMEGFLLSAAAGAPDGGGVRIEPGAGSGSVAMRRCIIANCAATAGGGISASGSDVTLESCVVRDCSAQTAAGIDVSGGSAHLAGCTVIRNGAIASIGGVLARGGADVTVINGVLWANSDATGMGSGAQLVALGASMNVSRSVVQGGYAGGQGVIDADPLLVGMTGRPGPASPCIDAGDSLAVMLGSLDVDGDARIADDPSVADTGLPHPLVGAVVDIGAYESASGPDCNGNGVPDGIDITSMASDDCNGNGIPDECETDCNGNGVADACDIASMMSDDCNGNGVPDECEADCDGNGAPDGCDLLAGDPDFDGSGTLDACEDLVLRLPAGSWHATMADGLAGAAAGDTVLASIARFVAEPAAAVPRGVTLGGFGPVDLPPAGEVMLDDGSAITAWAARRLVIGGAVRAGIGDRVSVSGDPVAIAVGGRIDLSPASVCEVLGANGLRIEGVLACHGAVLGAAGGVTVDSPGMLEVFGNVQGDVMNDGACTIIADAQMIGDVFNGGTGTITVQSGVLTVIGGLANEGTINGMPAAMRSEPPGMAVLGDLAIGPAGGIGLAAGGVLWAGGDLDIAAMDSSRWQMADAEVRCVGLGPAQRVEAASTDIGPDTAGLAPGKGRLPIGTLRIGPTPAVVMLVDDRDNDGLGQKAAEVVYATELRVDAGASLLTSGVRVYAGTAIIEGFVDDPANIIEIGASCAGDVNGDDRTDGADLSVLIGSFGSAVAPGTSGDVNGDGSVDAADLSALIGNFGCGAP